MRYGVVCSFFNFILYFSFHVNNRPLFVFSLSVLSFFIMTSSPLASFFVCLTLSFSPTFSRFPSPPYRHHRAHSVFVARVCSTLLIYSARVRATKRASHLNSVGEREKRERGKKSLHPRRIYSPLQTNLFSVFFTPSNFYSLRSFSKILHFSNEICFTLLMLIRFSLCIPTT